MENKKSKHTPGPWGVTRLQGVEYVTIDGGRVSVARVSALKTGEANARLIAAAPELLAALELALIAIDEDAAPKVAGMARAAIAKARGEK